MHQNKVEIFIMCCVFCTIISGVSFLSNEYLLHKKDIPFKTVFEVPDKFNTVTLTREQLLVKKNDPNPIDSNNSKPINDYSSKKEKRMSTPAKKIFVNRQSMKNSKVLQKAIIEINNFHYKNAIVLLDELIKTEEGDLSKKAIHLKAQCITELFKICYLNGKAVIQSWEKVKKKYNSQTNEYMEADSILRLF
jgi:hypothetical protein